MELEVGVGLREDTKIIKQQMQACWAYNSNYHIHLSSIRLDKVKEQTTNVLIWVFLAGFDVLVLVAIIFLV